MSRSYSRVRPKIHFVYDIDNIISLYRVSRNTVTNWMREGLQPSDDQTPKLFSGYELKRFHEERRERSKTGKLRSGEFICLRCKTAIFPEHRGIHSLNETVIHTGPNLIFATCPECNGQISKVMNETEWDSVIRCVKTNTSLESIDEGNGSVPACIVNQSAFSGEKSRSKNDRILYEWLKHAGKYDPKTINTHLFAIRDFEDVCDYICFTKLKIDHAAKYRDSLIQRSTMVATRMLSRSTISHRASYLRLFIDWLTNQKNYGRLNKSIPGYLELSRKQMAQALQPEPRPYPTMDQAEQMVKSMPARNLNERRNRCMVAVPFLSALRADATASLLIQHVNIAEKQIIQDANSMRTKNSKSLRVNWFPVPEIFETILEDWLEELLSLGFRKDDALFPHIKALRKLTEQEIREHPSIKPLGGASAVTKAFRTASAIFETDFTPHSAKHTLAELRDQICRTEIERKVFSENLGHSHERITAMYAKTTDELRKDTFDKLRSRPTICDDDKDLMLDYHDHRLTRGTPEFERAAQLVNKRRKDNIN